MTKRILALLFVLIFVIACFAGCGGNGNGKKGGSSGESEDEFFYDVPDELKGTTVKYATWIDHYNTESAQVMADFESITDIKVELVSIPQSEYVTKLAALIAADQSPDFVVENGDFPRSLSFLAPLNIEDNAVDTSLDMWDPVITEMFTVGKYVYALNTKNTTWNLGSCTYYNPTVLEENGIKSPADYVAEDNWNLDTFYTLASQIQKSAGYKSPATVIDEYTILSMFGGPVVDFDTKTDTFINNSTSANTAEAYKFMLKGREEKLFWLDRWARDEIANGTSALTIYGCYGLRKKPGWYYNMNYDDLAFEYLPKVNASDEQYPRTPGGRAYGVCVGAKNPKGAGYFLRYYTNTDHYDLEATFKNQAAIDAYEKFSKLTKVTGSPFVMSVMGISYSTGSDMFTEVSKGSSAQISTNLATLSNKVQGCVDLANGLIQNCINNQ